MAIYVKIQKIDQKNGLVIYKVSQDGIHFYIGINRERNEVEIYENAHLKAINIIKLNNEALPKVSGIPTATLAFTVLKAFKALRNPGELPEDISYCA
jgi:hypothetical protein